MAISVIAWRNWLFEYGVIGAASFLASTPDPDNMLNPRTSELAMSDDIANFDTDFEVAWTGGGRPVGMVAILNHNIIGEDSAPRIRIHDSATNFIEAASIFVTGSGIELQRHLYAFFEPDGVCDMNDIIKVSFRFHQRTGDVKYGTFDEYTDDYTPAEASWGAVWAGPIFRPTNGIKQDGFGQGVTEQKRGTVSIGGQVYRSREARVRRMPVTMPMLTHDEVYSLAILAPSLQRIYAWLCTSQPCIIIPDTEDQELAFMQGIFGYLDNDPGWSAVQNAGYTSSISITEAL